MSQIKRKINKRKWKRLSIVFGFSLFILAHYQNCAQVPHSRMVGSASADNGEDAPRYIIDPVQLDNGVAFVQKTVQVEEGQRTLELDGVCADGQVGATLRWDLRDQDEVNIGSGYADCDQGGFRLELSPVQTLKCGEQYTLSAQIGVGDGDTVQIQRDCGSSATTAANVIGTTIADHSDDL